MIENMQEHKKYKPSLVLAKACTFYVKTRVGRTGDYHAPLNTEPAHYTENTYHPHGIHTSYQF